MSIHNICFHRKKGKITWLSLLSRPVPCFNFSWKEIEEMVSRNGGRNI